MSFKGNVHGLIYVQYIWNKKWVRSGPVWCYWWCQGYRSSVLAICILQFANFIWFSWKTASFYVVYIVLFGTIFSINQLSFYSTLSWFFVSYSVPPIRTTLLYSSCRKYILVTCKLYPSVKMIYQYRLQYVAQTSMKFTCNSLRWGNARDRLFSMLQCNTIVWTSIVKWITR